MESNFEQDHSSKRSLASLSKPAMSITCEHPDECDQILTSQNIQDYGSFEKINKNELLGSVVSHDPWKDNYQSFKSDERKRGIKAGLAVSIGSDFEKKEKVSKFSGEGKKLKITISPSYKSSHKT